MGPPPSARARGLRRRGLLRPGRPWPCSRPPGGRRRRPPTSDAVTFDHLIKHRGEPGVAYPVEFAPPRSHRDPEEYGLALATDEGAVARVPALRGGGRPAGHVQVIASRHPETR